MKVVLGGTQQQCSECGLALEGTAIRSLELNYEFSLTQEDRLGGGSYGSVYACKSKGESRPLALKVYRVSGLNAKDAQYSRLFFLKELEALPRLRHSRVVRYVDFGIVDRSTPAIVMERVQSTLSKIRKASKPDAPDQTPPLPRLVRILDQLAEALEYLHGQGEHGIIHRDLKPENVGLDEDDNVRLLDFGSLRFIQPGEAPSATFGVGTYGYGAPEQFQDSAGPIGPWTDVHGWGAVAYWTLAGRPPVDAGKGAPLEAKLLATFRPAPLLQRSDERPDELDALIMACLRRTPGDRPQNMSIVREVLAKVAVLVSTGQQHLDIERAKVNEERQRVASEKAAAQKEMAAAQKKLEASEGRIAQARAQEEAAMLMVRAADDTEEKLKARIARVTADEAHLVWAKQSHQKKVEEDQKRLKSLSDDLEAQQQAHQRVVVVTQQNLEKILTGVSHPGSPIYELRQLLERYHSTLTNRSGPRPWVGALGTFFLLAVASVVGALLSAWLIQKNTPATPAPASQPLAAAPPEATKAPEARPSGWVRIRGVKGELKLGVDSPIRSGGLPDLGLRPPVEDFWLQEFEVTYQDFGAFQAKNGPLPPLLALFIDNAADRKRRPVTNISHFAARKYCELLGGDLPTEAQWEWAARGPGLSRHPWGSASPSAAFHRLGGSLGNVGRSQDINHFWESPIYDMGGHAQEWVLDGYRDDSGVDGRGDGRWFVVRGLPAELTEEWAGTFRQRHCGWAECTSAQQEPWANIGFRCARPAK